MDEDFGDDPTPPTDLTTFLEDGSTKEWYNAPSPCIPLTVDPPQLPHDNGHQLHPTHMGGAHPKTIVKPSAAAQSQSKPWLRGMPDPVDHPNTWSNHTHWWKEIKALHRSPVTLVLSKPKALLLSQ